MVPNQLTMVVDDGEWIGFLDADKNIIWWKSLNYVDIFSWLILHPIESVTYICYEISEHMEIFLYKIEFKA